MKIGRKLLLLWLALFIPFFLCFYFIRFKSLKQNEYNRRQLITQHIGEQFQLDSFLDIAGRNTTLNFAGSHLTIIDFWFATCPPCIKEMQQFDELLKGKEGKISIISISINSYAVWKNVFETTNPPFNFLKTKNPNWTHLVLKSNEDPQLKNDVPTDNVNQLFSNFHSSSFPMYVVVDKYGVIKDMPLSAVEYLKVNIENKNRFLNYLISSDIKTSWQKWLTPFIVYSPIFWILSILILYYFRLKKHRP